MKFGDIIVNGYASENNPRKQGVFVKQSNRSIQLTDMKGLFWYTDTENDKLECIGSVLKER
jgi:hypothetical protein